MSALSTIWNVVVNYYVVVVACFASQDKVGHNLKVLRRLVASLKEITIQKLAS